MKSRAPKRLHNAATVALRDTTLEKTRPATAKSKTGFFSRLGKAKQQKGWAKALVWTKENEWSSAKKIREAELKGVPAGSRLLSGNGIWVKGLTPYREGTRPGDNHGTKTEFPDSFTQGICFDGASNVKEVFNSADLGMTFEELLASRTKKKNVEIYVNDFEEMNAYYSPNDVTVHTGSGFSEETGLPWDLGSDQDVVKHELGHLVFDHIAPDLTGLKLRRKRSPELAELINGVAALMPQQNKAPLAGRRPSDDDDDDGKSTVEKGAVNAGAAMHEGFGDALAAFLHCDPEIGEDASKLTKKIGPGVGLRTASNDRTVFNTKLQPHDRGKVYAGLMWALGEHIHASVTGKSRDKSRDKRLDAEPLNWDAAFVAAKILLTYGHYLGTRNPTPLDFIRSVKEAIDNLRDAGKLPPKLDVDKLKDFVTAEGKRRGLISASANVRESTGESTVLPSSAKTEEQAVTQALTTAGFDLSKIRVGRFHQTKGPNGEVFSRYRIGVPVMNKGKASWAVIGDEYLTIRKNKDGTFSAQLGVLEKVAALVKKMPTPRITPNVVAGMMAIGEDLSAEKSVSSSIKNQLTTFAKRDLQRRLESQSKSPGKKAHEIFMAGVEEQSDDKTERLPLASPGLLKNALGSLKDAREPELIWSEGEVFAKLSLSTVTYYAPIDADGAMGEPQAEVAVICGPRAFMA